ncbi:hypothetical protein BS78_05G086300 [Paspalum vaginatum]|nr:hypothetical protein BS78_05G086300 [Paspalum vaginatum]
MEAGPLLPRRQRSDPRRRLILRRCEPPTSLDLAPRSPPIDGRHLNPALSVDAAGGRGGRDGALARGSRRRPSRCPPPPTRSSPASSPSLPRSVAASFSFAGRAMSSPPRSAAASSSSPAMAAAPPTTDGVTPRRRFPRVAASPTSLPPPPLGCHVTRVAAA